MPQGHQCLSIAMLAVMFIALLLSGCTKRTTVEPGAPPPDGSVRMETTAIAAGQGITWAEGQLRVQHQIISFVLPTPTRVDSSVLASQFAGEQVIATGTINHLRQVSDFAGTYIRIPPEEGHGRSGAGLWFQNEHGVVLQLTRIQKTKDDLPVQIPGERLTIAWP
jgi:hypothetical protein